MTTKSFKDHFSNHSLDYKKFRPQYPPQLFEFLADQCSQHDLAWDCATGSGQAASELAKHFHKVIATDASKSQLKNNIPQSNIDYRVATAEHSSLKDQSVDLITVAQALHWFDLDNFFTEVRRVLKPNGMFAAWSYNLLHVDNDIDEIISDLYAKTLGSFWPFERKMVENAYKDLDFPFDVQRNTSFEMRAEWDFNQLIGYLNTWSAVKAYIKQSQQNPVSEVSNRILNIWGEKHDKKQIMWPLTVIIGQP